MTQHFVLLTLSGVQSGKNEKVIGELCVVGYADDFHLGK